MAIDDIQSAAVPEELQNKEAERNCRYSGILVHPTSFPSPFGMIVPENPPSRKQRMREASALRAVRRSRKRPEFVSAKGSGSPSGASATIERTANEGSVCGGSCRCRLRPGS